jgi:stress responsive alpha/beta barrel protein
LTSLSVDAYGRAVLIHSVYFWFKADADPARVADFEAGLKRLISVPQVQQAYLGKPEKTPPRPVIDQSYDWALVVHFSCLADHDVYQEHPLHHEFLERFSATWERVQVYDARV